MKLNFGRRVLLFIYWLASLLALAELVIPGYVDIALSCVKNLIPQEYVRYVGIALLAIYILLSLGVLCMIFGRSNKKRTERGFITVDSAETGKVRIAISAIEQMVKQAAHTVDGIADMKISIDNSDDAIAIQVNVAMASGSHVPTVTLNMQRAIRQFVEMNCGVAVRSVSVSIQSVTSTADGSKKGKRHDAKPVAPVQEWSYQPEQPVHVELPANEPVAVENNEANVVVEAETIAEAVVCEETTDTVENELNNEEQKEN